MTHARAIAGTPPTRTVRPGDLLREALRAVQARPGRCAALVAAVAVAVALVVVTAGLAQSASSQVSDRFDVRRNREVAVSIPTGVSQDSGNSGHLLLAQDAETRVRALAGVSAAGVLGSYDQRAVSAQSTAPPQMLPLVGVSAGLLAAVGARIEWASGQPHRLGPRELIIGAGPARQIELASTASNPVVRVDGVPFGVVGVIRRVSRAPQMLASLIVSERDAKTFGAPESLAVLIRTEPGAAPQVARQAPVALDPAEPDRFEVRAPVDPSSLRTVIQSDLSSTLLALTLVAAVASMIGVANAMMVSVIERMSELGLRRALGARPVHILAQTSLEALLVGIAGGVVGLFAGASGVLLVTLANRWQPVLDLRLVPLALAGGAVVGVLGGLAAAVRASRVQPVDALRQ